MIVTLSKNSRKTSPVIYFGKLLYFPLCMSYCISIDPCCSSKCTDQRAPVCYTTSRASIRG